MISSCAGHFLFLTAFKPFEVSRAGPADINDLLRRDIKRLWLLLWTNLSMLENSTNFKALEQVQIFIFDSNCTMPISLQAYMIIEQQSFQAIVLMLLDSHIHEMKGLSFYVVEILKWN